MEEQKRRTKIMSKLNAIDLFCGAGGLSYGFEKAGFKMSDISCKYKKWHIDLWEANRLQLLDKKVGANNKNVVYFADK